MSPTRRVHDLTALLETHMATWATSPPPVFAPQAIIARDGYSIERIDCLSHTGTHLDAPYHFLEDGLPVDRIPPDRLVGTAAVLDLRADVTDDRIPATALAAHWPKAFEPEIALLETGWSHKRGATREYLYDFPGIDPEGAAWLIARGVKGVGTDALGIDPYSNAKFEAHKVLLGRSVWILEALDHLDTLRENTAYMLFAGPLKISGGSGAMARVFAVE